MMKFMTYVLIGFLIQYCVSKPHRCSNCAQRKTDLPVEQLRQLRCEYLKNQILKKLHLTEPPKTNLPKPPIKSFLVIAEMAENETAVEADDQPKTESVVIYSKDANLTCLENETYPCSRFEFIIPESLSLDNFLSAEVWLYKSQDKSIRAFQVITDHQHNLTSSFELDNIIMGKNIGSWIKYNVLGDNFRSNFAAENVLVIEVIEDGNETFAENIVGKAGDEKPFLVIRSETVEKSARRRRSATCTESSTACCKENFFLNFSEIGWDNWILHPDGYQANFCRGRCFNELSNTRFYHSAVLLSYIRDNKDIAEEIGLNMCCTPSVMAPVTIIYRNEEDLIYHKSIENMKVEACNCA